RLRTSHVRDTQRDVVQRPAAKCRSGSSRGALAGTCGEEAGEKLPSADDTAIVKVHQVFNFVHGSPLAESCKAPRRCVSAAAHAISPAPSAQCCVRPLPAP